jgi:hypothetical protein
VNREGGAVRRLVSALALAIILVLVASSSALAAGRELVKVSTGDPFAGCRLGGNGSALSFRSAEVEPMIADNPARTANLIGTWQQDRWSDGGAKGQVASWSLDAGRTWGQTPQPFTRCAQPFYRSQVLQYERTSDPWVSIGPDGTAYAVSLPFDGDFIRNGLGAAVSNDGGRTWAHQQDLDPLVARSDTLDPADDKESVTADPQRAGWAYAVWDQLQDVFPPCPTAPARAAVNRGRDAHRVAQAAVSAAEPCPNAFTGPAFFSRTRDGGRSWDKPRPIVPTKPNEQTIGNVMVVDRHSGALYDFFNYIDATGANNIEMVFSNDHGGTWSSRQYVQRLFTTAETRTGPQDCLCGVIFPGDPTKPLRTGDIIPAVTIDPNSGQLYVVWQDGRPNNFRNDMLLASTSTAGGRTGTWSAPVLVNPRGDKAAFTPGIAVDRKGRLGVIYYDFTPPLTSAKTLLTDTWFAASSGPGLDFGPRQLIGGPYNSLALPFARGFFAGDYEGLAARVPAPDRDSEDEAQNAQSGTSIQDAVGSGLGGFVPQFVMANCRDNSCAAQGTLDGSPKGPDSTDVFTSVSSPD